MRRILVLLVIAAMIGLASLPAIGRGRSDNFGAHLSGDQEVVPVDTRAQGQVMFKLSPDGESLTYKLIATNINDILMAHIHLAPVGVNGGIVVWLYPDGPPPVLIPGRSTGILAQGVITADDFVGDLDGADMSDLVDAFRSGGAYVNVHTSANPGGEIRGQVG